MGLKKLVVLVAILVGAAAAAGAQTVRITFTGACDFVYQKSPTGTGNLVTVYLPPYEPKYGQPNGVQIDIDKHAPFIRFASGGAFIIPDKATLSIDGSQPGVVDPSGSFESAVHAMTDKPSQSRLQQSISFPLPVGGKLTAQGGYERWGFLAHGETPKPTTPTESMASSVVFEYSVPSNSPIVLRVAKGGASSEFRIPFMNGVASLMIGNLPPDDIFFNGSYTPICEDAHYLLHQKLRDQSTEDATKVKLPRWMDCVGTSSTVTPMPATPAATPAAGATAQPATPAMTPMTHGTKDLYGPRNDCFMARWAV